MGCFNPDGALQAYQRLDRPLEVRRSFPRSGACSDRVMGTGVAEYHREGRPTHKRAQDVSETETIRVAWSLRRLVTVTFYPRELAKLTVGRGLGRVEPDRVLDAFDGWSSG